MSALVARGARSTRGNRGHYQRNALKGSRGCYTAVHEHSKTEYGYHKCDMHDDG